LALPVQDASTSRRLSPSGAIASFEELTYFRPRVPSERRIVQEVLITDVECGSAHNKGSEDRRMSQQRWFAWLRVTETSIERMRGTVESMSSTTIQFKRSPRYFPRYRMICFRAIALTD
jgi:hypothetical protein